jgi:hypothetical protein
MRVLCEYAETWNPERLTGLGGAEIYIGCLVTKNA